MGRVKDKARQSTIAVIGGTVLLVGLIAIPYPGPGWLIVFAGLAILGTEFIWAQQLLEFARSKYDNWQDWIKKQSLFIQVLFFMATCIVVVITLWLLNAYGIINNILGLGWDWVESPFFS